MPQGGIHPALGSFLLFPQYKPSALSRLESGVENKKKRTENLTGVPGVLYDSYRNLQ